MSKDSQSTLNYFLKLSESGISNELIDPYKAVYEKFRPQFDLGGYNAACELQKHVLEQPITEVCIAYDTERVISSLPKTLLDLPTKSRVEPVKQLLSVYYSSSLKPGEVQPTLVWVHGGGWFSGSKIHVSDYLKILALSNSGYTTVGVNYSVAPEYIYPTPLIQVNAALNYLVDNAEDLHIDPHKFGLAGDSAGAQIAAQMATLIANPEYITALQNEEVLNNFQPALLQEQLKCMVLCCGGYDFNKALEIIGGLPKETFAEKLVKFVLESFITTAMQSYSGNLDFKNDSKFGTFLIYDLENGTDRLNYVNKYFPPSFITAGDADPFNQLSRDLNAILENKGVKTDSLIYPLDDNQKPGLGHEYQFNLDDEGGYGKIALDRIRSFLKDYLGT